MDSKLQRNAIIISVVFLSFIFAMVFYVNKKDEPVSPSESVSGQETQMLYSLIGPNLSEEQLHAFLQDDTFFDDAPTVSDNISVMEIEALPRLYLKATSVCNDIRVYVLGEDGQPKNGEAFYINVDGNGEYKDVDRDGIITVPEMKAGEYLVSIASVPGYVAPKEPLKVTVKDKLEYKTIDNIDFYIYTEDQVDASIEDTGIQNAEEYADETESTEIKKSDKTTFGIDVSTYQGEIDWAKVKECGVEFAIIRAGYRGSATGKLVEDSYFKTNLTEAKRAGIQVGVYFFTQATNEIEAVEEASMVISLLEGRTIDYPIFIDTEGAGGNGRADLLDAQTRTNVCRAFCETVENSGYHGGVYASRNWYYRNLDATQLEQYVIWNAEYVGSPAYTGKFDMWQYTSSGIIDGINTRVDLDESYIEIN